MSSISVPSTSDQSSVQCSVVTKARPPSSGTPSKRKRSRASQRWFPMSCNHCQKVIDSTVFVCSCKCVFCEDCTHSHFQSSEKCPACGQRLTEDDFTEVMVSDPNDKVATNPHQIIQSLLTKTSNQPDEPLTMNDMCTALMKEHDSILVNTNVFVKQFVRQTQQSLQAGKIAMNKAKAYQRQAEAIRKDNIGLKERYEECTKQIHEKDRQIQQLRLMLSKNEETQFQHGSALKNLHANQIQKKDNEIRQLRDILNKMQNSYGNREEQPGIDFSRTLIRDPGFSRSSPGILHSRGMDRPGSSSSALDMNRQRSDGRQQHRQGSDRSDSSSLEHGMIHRKSDDSGLLTHNHLAPLHREGSSRSTPSQLALHRQRSDRPTSSRSTPSQLVLHHQRLDRSGSSSSIPGVIHQRPGGSFQEYMLKKERGEIIQERDLINHKRKKNPMVP